MPGQAMLGDCLEEMRRLPEQSIDLVFGSPPYEDARTYGIDFKLKGQAWVDWMVQVYRESLRVCRGLVAFVVEGRTRHFSWSGTPALLMADLIRAGITLRKPPIYERDGIPGSGGPDWWKNRYEFIVCATNGGKLPWSDNTAMGHPCLYDTGGACSNRTREGARVRGDKNLVGAMRKTRNMKYAKPEIANPGNVILCEDPLRSPNCIDILIDYGYYTKTSPSEVLRCLWEAVNSRRLPQWWARVYSRVQEAQVLQSYMQGVGPTASKWPEGGRSASQGEEDSSSEEAASSVRSVQQNASLGSSPSGRGCHEQRTVEFGRALPVVPQEDAQERALYGSRLREEFLGDGLLFHALPEIQKIWDAIYEATRQAPPTSDCPNLIDCGPGGGGNMGSPLASLNEAPFPEKLAEFFVRSFCPPSGVVLDPFGGSGTTVAVAERLGRNWITIDIRPSQIELIHRRIREVRGRPEMPNTKGGISF